MYEHQIRLECLKLARSQYGDISYDTALMEAGRLIEVARLYSDFVLGKSDAEVIRAARNFAEKVKGG